MDQWPGTPVPLGSWVPRELERSTGNCTSPWGDLGSLGPQCLLALGLRFYFKGSPHAVSQAGPPPRLRNTVIFTNMSATFMEC